MKYLLQNNIDYLYFLYGASFVLLGTSCLILFYREKRKHPPTLAWIWLSLFGFVRGLKEWLEMLSVSAMDFHFLIYVRHVLFFAGFIFLIEFTRRSLNNLKNMRLTVWIYLPLALLLALGFFITRGKNFYFILFMRNTIGLIGTFGAAHVFWIYSHKERYFASRLFFRILSVLFLLFAIPMGAFFERGMAEILRDFRFYHITRLFPVAFVRTLFITLISFFLIFRATKSTFLVFGVRREIRFIKGLVFSLIFSYVVFLFVGFLGINAIDRHQRDYLKRSFLADARLFADGVGKLDPGVFKTAPRADVYTQYLRVHNRLGELAQISPFVKSLYLIAFDKDKPVFSVSSKTQVFPGGVRPVFHPQIPHNIIRDAFHSKQITVFGTYEDHRGDLFLTLFVPLGDKTGSVTNLLGIDLDGLKIQKSVFAFRLLGIFTLMAFLMLLVAGYAFLIVFLLKSLELEVQKNNLDVAIKRLKETESELARSEETFRGILNNSPNAIFGFDRDLRLIFWNYGAESLYGYKKEEVINERDPLQSQSIIELLGLETIEAAIANVFRGDTFLHDIVTTSKEGPVEVNMTVFPVKDGEGHILFGLGLAQNISEHLRYEEKLAQANARLNSVLDGAGQISIIGTDVNGVINFFNRGSENLFGYAASEVVGKKTPEIFHDPAEIKAFADEASREFGRPLMGVQAVVEYARQGKVLHREWTHLRKDGTSITVDLTVSSLRNEKGQLIGYIGFCFDISNRTVVERALQASQQKYKELVDNLNVGVYRNTPGPEGHFIEINPAMVTMFEADSEGHFLKHVVADLYVDRSKRKDFSDKLSRQGYVRNEPLYLKTLKGRFFWASCTAILKQDEKGESYFYGIIQDISEQKELEIRLTDERDRLRNIATSIGAGLSLVDKNYNIVWVNEILEGWFGKLGSIEGKKCFETYQFKTAVCAGCPVKNVFETGRMQSAEQTSVFPDGRKMHFLIIVSPIKNPQGEVEQVLELTLDVTERRKIFELLEYERALSRNVIDSINDPLMVLDCRHRTILDVNRSFEELTGLTKHGAVGKRCDQLKPYFCPSCEACDFTDVTQKGRSIESTHIHRDATGKERCFDVSLSPLRDETGKIIGVIHISRDVTDRKHLEDKLRRYSEDLELLVRERTKALATSELMFRNLFESAQDGILIIDPESGTIINANPYLLTLLECTREELQGHIYRDLSRIAQTDIFERIFLELKERPSAYYDDLLIKTSRDKDIIVELNASLYFVEDKKVIQCNIRDITERRKLEKIKTEFVSMVSHELRTPLSAIKEGVEIVVDGTQGKVNRKQKECLNISLSNIKRLNRLIGDILDISKIQSNLLKVQPSLCNVYEIIEQVYSLLKIEIEKRGMIFVTDCRKDLPFVLADKDRLMQILMNLLNNAVKFTREKSRITLTCKKTGDFVEFGVRDEGEGISEEEVARLFGRFVQLDSTLVRRVGGTGLGLYISRNLVEAMGGRIWVESQVGEGSCFKFTVPIKKEDR